MIVLLPSQALQDPKGWGREAEWLGSHFHRRDKLFSGPGMDRAPDWTQLALSTHLWACILALRSLDVWCRLDSQPDPICASFVFPRLERMKTGLGQISCGRRVFFDVFCCSSFSAVIVSCQDPLCWQSGPSWWGAIDPAATPQQSAEHHQGQLRAAAGAFFCWTWENRRVPGFHFSIDLCWFPHGPGLGKSSSRCDSTFHPCHDEEGRDEI